MLQFWRHAFLFVVAAIVLAADQYTKYLVRANLPLGETWMPVAWLARFVVVAHTTNTGAAFGMFKSGGGVFTVVAVVVVAFIIVYYRRIPPGQWLVRLALGLQLGGALGNLIDRLRFGTVTDFVAVGVFPVFNAADASISVGVAILALAMWLEGREERRAAQAAAPGTSESHG